MNSDRTRAGSLSAALLDVIIAVAAAATVGLLDYATGNRYSFFVFYFLPVAHAAWKINRTSAVAVALLCTLLWYVAGVETGEFLHERPFVYWNGFVRLISFLIIAFGVSHIRTLLDRQRLLAAQLQTALDEVRTLTGFLPICARCKKIRDDGGYWRRLEEYIEQRTPARFTHGYCERCANQLLADAGLPPKFTEQPAAADDDPH